MNHHNRHQLLQTKIKELLAIVADLSSTFSPEKRRFTLDGRLVGDIGEIIAYLYYDITLDEKSRANYDARSGDKLIQIKATMQDHLTFKNKDGYFLGLRINPDGTHEEIYNGPALNIHQHFNHRKNIGTALLRFRNTTLRELCKLVPENEKISFRDAPLL